MWRKDENRAEEVPVSTRPPQPEVVPERPAAPPRAPSSDRALIGRSITIRGDVTGDEDLVIQGSVEGSIDLTQHTVTVGSNGEVRANISGRVITIEGRVVGNVDGGEQVTLRSTAHVQGDITAPRVVLENGARFRGLVDMGEVEERAGHKGGGTAAKRAGNGRSAGERPEPGPPASGTPADAEGAITEPQSEASSNGTGKHRAGAAPEPQLVK